MSTKYYLDWKEVDYNWIEKDWNWIDVYILIEETVGEILGGDYHLDLDPLSPWESMEKKLKKQKIEEPKINKFLEVIVSVKGQSKTFKKEIKEDSKKISIEDIQKTLNRYGHSQIKVKAEIKK
jgi:hypothetical protein